ncbi:MAG: hypothetical protein JF887_10090 [Candidatus Dormibacteraeota bacterium]|uniref:Protein kinase domain-containing protein n=1 Tax=Candidatus Amunia macphersoniae TaxID=3127014 RepID=A0A934NJN7_9BACT|nr:hypothetical protein [Candidatus Dormibacteraeota bacterium]
MGRDRRDYDVGELLRQGWAGPLRDGRYRQTGRRVTVQDIRTELTKATGFVERLADIGRRSADVRDPHLLAVYDLVVKGEQMQLIAEWSAAPTLAALIGHRRLTPQRAVVVIDGVLAGLGSLHGAGLVHGRVAADTTVVEEDGTARLAELAICAVASPPGIGPVLDLRSAAQLGLDLLQGTGPQPEPVRLALEQGASGAVDAAAMRSSVAAAARTVFGADATADGGGGEATAAPPRRRRSRRMYGVAAVALVALITAAAAGYLLLAGHGNRPASSGPLAVGSDATLSVNPGNGACNTTFVFVGKGSLTGTGKLVYRWEQSDGQSSSDASLPITADEGAFQLTQAWRLQGTQTVDGTMTLHILRPLDRVLRQSFHYVCR